MLAFVPDLVGTGRKTVPRNPFLSHQLQLPFDQIESLLQSFLTYLGHLEVTFIPIVSLEPWFPKCEPRGSLGASPYS